MRLKTPRVAPLQDHEFNDEHKAALAPFMKTGAPVINIIRTMVRHPQARTAFGVWGNYILSADNSLTAREREILILRAGYLCRSGYEFAQHRAFALRAGLSNAEIENIKAGAEAGWKPDEANLIRACDEMVGDHFISDATWKALSARYNERQLMDIVFTTTQYVQVSTMLNTFGVQVEDGVEVDADMAPA